MPGTDLTVPFKILKSKQSFKTGFYFQHKDRAYSSRIFGFIRGNSFSNTNLYKPSKPFSILRISTRKDLLLMKSLTKKTVIKPLKAICHLRDV